MMMFKCSGAVIVVAAASVIILLVFTSSVISLHIPDNPCPQHLRYVQESNGVYYGDLTIPYDGSHILKLGVNVSLLGYYQNLKLKLDLRTPHNDILSQRNINYRIVFPLQNVLPKITQVQFNGGTFCSGPPEPLGMAGVTNLWAGLVFRIQSYTYTIRDGVPAPAIAPTRQTTTIPVDDTPVISNTIIDAPKLSNNPFLQSNHHNHQQSSKDRPIISSTTMITPTTTATTTRLAPTIFQRGPTNNDNNNNNCGVANEITSLILNGEPTIENEYPWLVALFHRQGISYQFQCTANLISHRHIITAAHCIQFYKAPLLDKDDMVLILGQSNLTHWATSGATIRTVSDVFIHPEYRQYSGHCDAAIIKMAEPVTFKSSIRPICLWDPNDNGLDAVVHASGVVTGWGRDETDRVTVPDLRKVTMPIVSQESCLRSNQAFFNLTSDLTFCAGNRDGSGPCTGDSGAGFMIKQNKKWSLRGLVSTAIKSPVTNSCNLQEYIVFSDIAKLTDWIKGCLTK